MARNILKVDKNGLVRRLDESGKWIERPFYIQALVIQDDQYNPGEDIVAYMGAYLDEPNPRIQNVFPNEGVEVVYEKDANFQNIGMGNLIKLADLFDRYDHYRAADLIDQLIKQSGMYIPVKDLPPALQSALAAVDYAKKDVEVNAADKVSIQVGGGQGSKGFAIVVNLMTGQHKVMEGSWGGANMFNPRNQVDLDRNEHTIPEGGAVVKGTMGYGGTWAVIYVHPASLAPLLPTQKSELTEKQRKILAVFKQLISSARKEYLHRLKATQQDIEELIAGGYLKRNAAGSISITTLGKNNAGRDYY